MQILRFINDQIKIEPEIAIEMISRFIKENLLFTTILPGQTKQDV